jgi:uncharacterized coiled-coil protein SlyX
MTQRKRTAGSGWQKRKRNKRQTKKTGSRRRNAAQPGNWYYEQMASIVDEQLVNLEMKIAIQQFMLNQLIDFLSDVYVMNDQQKKELYANTYQYWKNELQGTGRPFEPFELGGRPVFNQLKKGGAPIHPAMDHQLPPMLPSAPPPQKHAIYADQAEWSTYLGNFKDEIKKLRREMMKMQMEEIKKSMLGSKPGKPFAGPSYDDG